MFKFTAHFDGTPAPSPFPSSPDTPSLRPPPMYNNQLCCAAEVFFFAASPGALFCNSHFLHRGTTDDSFATLPPALTFPCHSQQGVTQVIPICWLHLSVCV